MSSHSSHHPREVLLAQFSLYVHKSGLKQDSYHFQCIMQDQYENFIINTNILDFIMAAVMSTAVILNVATLYVL